MCVFCRLYFGESEFIKNLNEQAVSTEWHSIKWENVAVVVNRICQENIFFLLRKTIMEHTVPSFIYILTRHKTLKSNKTFYTYHNFNNEERIGI